MLDHYTSKPRQPEGRVRQSPTRIIENTLKLKSLAVRQVVSLTIASSLDFILNERPHCDDLKLQRSMISDLYQWFIK